MTCVIEYMIAIRIEGFTLKRSIYCSPSVQGYWIIKLPSYIVVFTPGFYLY